MFVVPSVERKVIAHVLNLNYGRGSRQFLISICPTFIPKITYRDLSGSVEYSVTVLEHAAFILVPIFRNITAGMKI